MAANWEFIQSMNVVESMFATISRRREQTNGNGSREAVVRMMFMRAKQAENTWRRINGFVHAASILHGIVYQTVL
jgi:hypothetical protein